MLHTFKRIESGNLVVILILTKMNTVTLVMYTIALLVRVNRLVAEFDQVNCIRN